MAGAPVSAAYWRHTPPALGPGSRNRSSSPLSANQCASVPAPDGAALMSTYCSAALSQKAPTVRAAAGACASSSGMAPYSPNGESARYSYTSSAYSRKGSDSAAPSAPRVAPSASAEACSGMPYACAAPGKRRSTLRLCGPLGLLSVWLLYFSSHAPSGWPSCGGAKARRVPLSASRARQLQAPRRVRAFFSPSGSMCSSWRAFRLSTGLPSAVSCGGARRARR